VDEANDAKVENLFKRGVNTVSKRLKRGANTESNGRRRSSGKALETKTDKSIIAVKIIQVGDEESTIEVLVDTPKKHYKKRKMVRVNAWYARKATVEEMGSTNGNILEVEKKETERVLPTLYDYRTLSSMQRCFQRWRPLASLDEKDGEVFGKMLMANTSKLFDVKERSEKSRKAKSEWYVVQAERARPFEHLQGPPGTLRTPRRYHQMEFSIFGRRTKRRIFVLKTASYGAVICTREKSERCWRAVPARKACLTSTCNSTTVRSVESDVSIFGLPTKHRYFDAKTSQRASEATRRSNT